MLNATNTLTIRIKLYLLIGLSLALMLMLSLQGMYAQNRQSAALGRSLDEARIAMEAIESSDSAALHFKIQVQEWKNLLIRGHDAKDFERYLKAFQTEHAVVEGLLKKCSEAFRKLGIDLVPVTKARDAHEELRGKYLEAAKRFDPKDPLSYQLVDKAVRGIDRLPTEQIDKLSMLANDAIAKRFDVARSDAQSLEKLMLGVSLTVLVLALVVSISLAVTLVRGISRQLQSAVAAADSVASGDLTVTVVSHSKDEIGQLLTKLGVMTASLSKIVAEVRVGSHEIATASQQIAAGNINLSARTEEQASAI